MKKKPKGYKPYRKKRTPEEYRQWLEEEKRRLEFRLSHQKECFIYSVAQERRDLEWVNEELRRGGGIFVEEEDLHLLEPHFFAATK